MGLGNTAKKVQTVADTAEKLYSRVNELRDQLQALRQQVDATSETVDRIEADVRTQRALLVALAEREGIDAEAILAEGAIEEAEPTEPVESTGSATADATEGTTATVADSTDRAGPAETDGSGDGSAEDS